MHLLSYFLLLFNILYSSLAIRYVEQFPLDEWNDQLYTDYQVTDINPQFSETETMPYSQICANLYEVLVGFGKENLNSQNACDEKHALFGEKHSVIQRDQPSCFLKLESVFCDYELENESESLLPDSLRRLITSTIKGCIKGIKPENYVCTSLEKETSMILNEEEFCKNLENVKEEMVIRDEDEELADSPYETYSFVGKESRTPCIAITKLYNYCQKSTQKLGMDSQICFSQKFVPYKNTLLKKYNTKIKEKCTNVVLPFFSYLTTDEEKKASISRICQDIDDEMATTLKEKQDVTTTSYCQLQQNLTFYKETLQNFTSFLDETQNSLAELNKLQQFWIDFAKSLMGKAVPSIPVTKEAYQALINLNITVNEWMTTGNSSLDYIRYVSTKVIVLREITNHHAQTVGGLQKLTNSTTNLQNLLQIPVKANNDDNGVKTLEMEKFYFMDDLANDAKRSNKRINDFI